MRIPTAGSASDYLLNLGRFHLAALAQREATKPLATAFRPVQEALQTAASARALAEDALTTPRVQVRFAENSVERLIRRVAMAAHSLDNNASRGPAYNALFPAGMNAELRPSGSAQVMSATDLRKRLDTHPAAGGLKAQLIAEFDKALADLIAALEARRTAEMQLAQTRAAEEGARAAFVAAYDSNAGAIRQLFPRDRIQQDLHFEQIAHGRPASNDKNNKTPDRPVSAAT